MSPKGHSLVLLRETAVGAIKSKVLSDTEAEQEASEELQPGERLVWVGRPIPARVAWSGAAPLLFLVGLFWTGAAIYWTLHAGATLIHPPRPGTPASSSEIAFVLFGIPFLIVGIIILCMPFWAYRAAAGTVYAITSQRLLIISRARVRRVRSISSESVASIERRERAGGIGDLIFRQTSAAPSENAIPWRFFAIANAREAEDAIRNTFPKFGA